jgi:hypothetical protein
MVFGPVTSHGIQGHEYLLSLANRAVSNSDMHRSDNNCHSMQIDRLNPDTVHMHRFDAEPGDFANHFDILRKAV